MPALITDSFRLFSAQQFVESLSEPSGTVSDTDPQRSKIYLFIGRSQPWSVERYSGNVNVSDSLPPNPEDSFNDLSEVYDDMIALKRVKPSDIKQVIPKKTWSSGTIYDMYRHDYTTTKLAPSGASKLFDADFYVMNSKYQVFKCIYNGTTPENPNGIQTGTTAEPLVSGSTSNIITTSDGYKWKFLYELSTDEVLKFVTSDFIPIATDSTVKTSAVNGAIDTIVIKNRGVSLTPGTYYSAIIGDGNLGVARIIIGNTGTFANKIETVAVQSTGSGYTYAKIDISKLYTDIGLTTAAAAMTGITSANGTTYLDVIIPPPGGHGSSMEEELGAFRVLVNSKLEFLDGSGDIPVDISFRRFGLIANPFRFAELVQQTEDTISACRAIKFPDSFNYNYTIGETITQSTTNARGIVIHWDSINKILRYYQNEYSGLATTGSNVNKLVAFSGLNAVTGSISGISGNPDTAYTSGISGAASNIAGIVFTQGYANPELQKYSGEILYIEHRKPIVRSNDQIEDIKLVIEF